MATIAIKERPILMQGETVRAILEGRKTQTRRVVKHHERYGCPTGDCPHECQWQCNEAMNSKGVTDECPYGKPGDRLWVREAWWMHDDHRAFGDVDGNCFDEDGNPVLVNWDASMDEDSRRIGREYGCRKRPPIHMPRWASRITLEITGVRVERVQSINPHDALAEGADFPHAQECPPDARAVEWYRDLWDRINGKRDGASWASNPWVWVVDFRRVKP